MQDALLPRPPGGLAPGAALALLVHGGLIAALTLGVNWRMKAPEVISAELWAALPQVAAPRVEAPAPTPAPPPPPPAPAPPPRETAPNEAQIAIERAAKQQKLERDKKEEAEKIEKAEKKKLADKREADAADKKKREAEEKKKADELAKAREDQIKRMLAGLPGTGAPTSTGTAERSAAPSQAYVGRLVAAIKAHVIFDNSVSGNPAAEVEVTTGASGTILSRRITKRSGNDDWDEAVLRAIDRTGTLPLDNGRSPPSITITFRPKE